MKRLVLSIVLAAVLWSVMFSPLTAPHVNFWLMMSLSALTLSVLSLRFDAGWRREADSSWTNLLLGIVIAAALWGIFWTGDKVSTWLFDFARPQVNWLLSVLMLVLIGPAEEIFWRGYVQRTLSRRWTPNAGFVVTTLVYALVHAASCNFMLVMAALVAGVVWGGLYRLYPRRMWAIIVSHAVWDVAVFVWFPI